MLLLEVGMVMTIMLGMAMEMVLAADSVQHGSYAPVTLLSRPVEPPVVAPLARSARTRRICSTANCVAC